MGTNTDVNTDDAPDAGDLEIVPAEIDVTDIPASSDASDEPVHIFADYYGNLILYDEAKTQEALTVIDNYAQSFKALLILLEAMMLF